MQRIWNHSFQGRLLVLTSASGMLLAFPGCGSRWWDYAIDFGAGFISAQIMRGFLAI